ncbi:PREDICTED: microtubule-associated protein futsch isoform X3 [Atta colombica]|uniref:microtubule-associated protein futsch isoform X3 n=1 Tax=Atta colombica TaxID=520822 RepID=UPI00084C004F|nr:PREDICTED: microtubule-associated protein futsch isoform X3 [Atta colombica]
MSTTEPTGEGGGGGEGESATMTNVEQTPSPSTPITGTSVSMQAATQQQQQPQQHPPPSPLSGCYLLVVLPEPHTAQHKDLILNRLAKGFLSWDKDSCHVDLEKELLALVAQAPEGEEARNGERLIQYATENLVTEVLIHPQTNTLLQCIRNLLASFTKHRHIIHAGYTFGGNGSWILQDGTFSLADFLDAFSEHEVQRVLRAYENSVTVDIHCAGVGDWTTSRLSKETCCRSCRVRVNPDDVLTAGVPAIMSFTNYIGQYLVSQTLDQLMEPSDVVGNIRFSHPTLYVFPGGQGDAALFGINGFNMLVDGGFARKACFWDFTRHLDRLDAVLVTRINNSNIGGMFSVLRKKKEMHVYPQIGHFFCNLVERRQSNSPDGDKDIDPLIFNLTDIGQEMVVNLRHINLRAHPCYRDPDPINLYHKVGHGTLDMYVLSPSKDSREVREFLAKWHTSDSKLFAGSHKKDSNNLTFPMQNLVSICALLVWQPANPEDNITRILFPGSTPQHKIFEGFERLKHLDFLKHPVCSAKTLSPSVSLATLRDKSTKQKLSLIEKEPKKILETKKEKREPSEPKSIKAADETVSKSIPQSTPIIPANKPKTEMKTKKVVENKKIETETKESKKIEKELKEVKKEPKKESIKVEKAEKREEDVKKTDLIKPEPEKIKEPKESKESKEPKEPKPKPEPKKKEPKESKMKVELKKSEVTPKPKLIEKKAKSSGAEKRDAVKSSPTTPKKTLNGAATKTEISKAIPKVKPAVKVAPSLPAKSAKEANNRKVVEQKKSEVEKSAVKDSAAPVVKVTAKPKPMDRKPISRRAKPVSPNKARMPGSPAKSTRSTPTASVKSDKDGVIRKVKGDKGTTDSSTVSTPSGIEPEVIKPIDKSLIEQSEDISLDSIESKVLADLKEEREVVEEIEAVLQKAERIEEIRKDDRFEGDDEITAEATDKKEEDITEEDVTAEIEDIPKKEGSRKESQELTEEDEYLIVEKEEVYTEDSAQSGEGEQKHVLDEAQSEKAKILKDVEAMKEKGEKEEPEEKEKDDSPEKKIEKILDKEEKEIAELSSEHKEQLQEEVKEIIASAAEIVQKAEEKDDSGKKDSEDITKEPSSLSPDKLDSSEKKTTDTDIKPDVDQKENILEKMEESQERISTIESGATTTAPTLPEDERIPLDEIKEDIDEKHVIEEVKEKDASAKLKKEVIPETIIVAAKPEVKVFDVRQAMPNLQRDIVKTPDEVADLPVHEEVDPKLYRMEDFEKGKEEKLSPTAQEDKESPIPPAKEQKSVFSFFGKVADKFEKGIDKLTKKKKDSEKDSDEKSSKSSSPKEPKVQEKTVLEEVDMEKVFPKIGKPVDKPETFEEAKPTTVDIKVAAIKETAAFIQEEILDVQRKSVPDIEEKLFTDKLDEIKKIEAKIEESFLTKDVSPGVSPTKLIEDKEIAKEIELLKEEDIGEDVEEVKALLEEASKKFKTVKDSLRDSLESLEDKIKEEIVEIHETPSALKDIVKDTLEGVAEKLEEIKPHIESHLPDIKEPEKVKFAIPKDEEFEEEYEEEIEGPYRDMKEAVRDVGEVLAGTAGIELEDKPKDVIEIVKKVAEVLREDDFLSDKALFEQTPKKEEISPISTERKPSKEEISPILTERKPSISSEKISPEIVAKLEEEELKLVHEDIVMPKKVDVTEVFPVHKELEKFEKPDKLPYEKPGVLEVKEEPCVKVVKEKDDIITSPIKDIAKDKRDAQKICEEILKDDQDICDQHKKPTDDDTSRVDVMQAGIEDVCVKEVAKRPSFEKKLEDEIEESMIVFEQKISPAKAEIVMVTPGSTPTSPKFVTDKIYDEGLEIGYRELPEDIKQILSKEVPIEEIIEELVITKKKKVTIEVIEYVTVTKRIPRERVIYIIEEIITKKGLLRENVIDDSEILRLKESITLEKRMEIEEYILNEYIVKGKRITIEIVQEISIKKVVPKKIIIEIIEEIIVKRKLARHMVLNVPEEALSEIIQEKSPEESPEQSAEEQITEEQKIDIPAKQEFAAEVSDAPTGKEKLTDEGAFKPYIEEFIVNEYVIKGKKITASTIDDISIQKTVPKQILIEIIEEIIIKKKIPRNTILDVTEKELLVIFKKIFEDEKEKLVAETTIPEIPETESIISQERAEVEEYIINEYVTKGDNINIKKLEEICGKKKVPKKIIIEIIEEIIIKKKIPRHIILSVTDEELSHIIKEEAIPESQILTEKPVAEMPSIEEKKSPIELKKDKKEDVLEQEMSAEEELLATSEEEDIEKEVDGFVSIPRRISDTVDIKKAISQIPSSVTKEHEKDVIDDFEAVEQEYKVRDVQSPEKASEMKEKEDIEESVEDTTSEVIEADEKFVQETKGKVGIEELHIAKDIKPIDEKREPVEQEISEISEIVDTTEKYLDEAKEKTDDILQKETATTLTPSISEKAEKPSIEDSSKETPKDFSDKQPSIDAPDISKSIIPSPKIIDEKLEMKEIEPAIKEEVEELQLKKVAKEVKAETKLADATGFTQEPKVELLEDDKKSKPLETTEIKETPIIKEEKSPQETLAANIPKPFDDGTVKRMLVTACSEDGREEIEICPSGSITFTKTVTPDDSLKDVSAKSTPDKDSLLLDKDSRSDISTPEKDSISEKSAPEGKDKITPEDSLEKSPAGPRDSQDLEDSLEKSELHKPKVPEELEDITKSPMEKDLKVSDKIAEKDIPKSPKEEQVEPKSPTKEDEKIEKMKSPAEEKIEKSSSPIEKIEKSRSPSSLDTTTQKSLIELAEKSKLPIEKVPEPKKKETIGVSKTPESLHSEDVSPAETIFSKSPTDKSEMYFAKAPVTEEDVAIEKDIKKLPESIKEIKTEDKELPISLEKSDQDIKSLDKSPTILSDKVDEKENYKLKSPSIMEKETVSEKLPIFESEYYDEKGPIDESPSAISDKSDEKKEAERSKSPSIAVDKPDLQDVTERYLEKPKSPIFDRSDSPKAIDKTEESHDKDRSPSVASDKSDSKKISDRSRSPSVSIEKVDFERTRSSSVTSVKDDKLEQFPVAKSPEISKDVLKSSKLEEDKSDLKDIIQPLLDKSPSVTNGISESKEPDRSKSPIIAGEKPEMKDMTETPVEKSRSPSVISVTSEQKEPIDRSKSPSIAEEKIDLKDVAEPADRSKSPSVIREKPDLKDVIAEKSRSFSITGEQKESLDHSKSPSIAGEKPDLKDVTAEKSRSSSITEEQKESLDRSKSPSIAGEKLDLKDVIELSDEKSKSGASMSVTTDSKGLDDRSKSPSSTDLTDITEQSSLDKSKSPSVTSITSDQKESTEKAKSPIPDKKEELDRSKSPSITSEKSDEKKSVDGSKATSVTEEKPDLKDVMELPGDKSRSSSVASEKELFEKSTSPVSDKLEPPVDRSKSPSIASDKSDEKTSDDKGSVKEHYESAGDKSPNFVDVKIPHEKAMEEKPSTISGKMDVKPDDIISHDRPVSPSIVFDKPIDDKQSIEKIDVDGLKTSDIIDDSDFVDKTRSLSIISDKTEPKSTFDVSKSPSLIDDQKDKSRSSSVASERLDDIKISQILEAKEEQSISPSLADDQKDKSRSSSVASERLDDIKVSQIPEAKRELSISPSSADDQKDKSKSSSERVDDIKVSQIPEAKGEQSISPSSIDGQKDKSRSSSVASERLDDIKVSQIPEAKIEQLISPSSADDQKDKSRSSSVASERLDNIKISQVPEAKGERSISPSSADDQKDKAKSSSERFDDIKVSQISEVKAEQLISPSSTDGQKDKSRSSSVASERFDDIKVSQIPEAKGEQSISPSLDTGKIPKDESAKSSRASSPVDKTPKDRSRSQSVFDAGEKTPTRSRTASLFDDKLSEKPFQEEKHFDMGKPLDEKVECKKDSKSPITSPETIEKKMQKIREKRFADFKEPDIGQPSKVEKSDDEEEDVIKVTAEKKAEIEKYIIDEFIVRKRKISLTVIERLVMTYSVPQFIVMEIIEDIINRQNIPRSAVFDFVDDKASSEPQYGKESETELLAPQERAKVEEYIIEEFIMKKKKITPEVLEEMVIVKSVPRYILITIIEEIIVKKKILRNTIIEGDLGESGEKDLDISEKREEPVTSASVDFGKVTQDVTQEDIHSHEKSGDTTKESLDGKISPAGSDRYGRDSKAALSASPSLSPEPIPSDKSTQDSPARSEPHIDEEILISEEKRMEIEKLLEEEYIKKGKKITEVILEEIIIMTSLPRYIILEIVEEIILKRKIPRESVIDVEIYQEEEPEDYDKAMYHYEGTTDVDYELPHARDMYPESGEQQLDKSDYPSDYESQFHKAFVGGMTEMRTTHITTLSGKSTPEFTHDTASKIESTDKVPEKLSESTLTTTHITRTDVEDTKAVQSAQTITILRESKITETVDKDKSEESAGISATVTSGHAAESDGDVIVSKTTIKHEVIKEEESGKTTEVMKGIEPPGFGPQEIVKEIEQSSIQQDEPEAITKIIKEEIMEHDEPEVVTKVVKREIIEQDEPEIITKVIRREIVIPDEEISDSKEDSGEYMKTITTKKTTRTIVTEELADAELAQADPSKIHTDPTSDSTYKAVSDEGDAASADIKRIVTTVTTITGPDGKVTTKTDVKESTDTLAGEEVLEKLTETTKSAEKIIKETITTVTSGTTTPDVKAFYSDSGKSTPDLKHEAKLESTIKERLDADKFEHPVSPLIRELISDDKSYSGKSSPDISLPKDIVFSGKSTPEVPTSPLIRDGAVVQPHVSGRSTPDKRSDCRSSTSTPEGFRSGEMIRTIVTTTKTVSDEGEIVTTTREVTETTNEKGETVVLAEKTDVKVDERLPSKDAAESAISSIIGSIKSSELQRGDSPGSDDIIGEKDHAPVSPSSEYSSTRSKVMTHPWGSSEERHTYSDDEPPSSSLSSTSQVGYSPQITHHYESSSDKQEEQKQVEFSVAAMSSSFYGELPAVPPQISAMKTFHGETGMQKSSDPIHSRFTVEKEPAGDYGEKLDAKRYVDEADLDFDKALMDKEMKEIGGTFSSGIAPRYTNGNLRHEATDEKDHPSSSFRDDKDDSKGDSKKDPLEGWGTPLGLPSPKPPKKFNLKNSAQFPSCSSETTSDTLNFDVVKNWGEPLRLPSPAPVTNEISNKGAPSTPKKERKQAKKIQSENIKNKKRSESPGKNEKKIKDSKNKVQPVYMDLAYVPHHGNSYYTSLEFFKRVRARYYVFSGTEPSREVYDALLEAKKTWEDKDLEVTMIPTYDTDTLGYWVADNEEALAANHIDLSPSASRCTINLQDHETSCSAYRLEF